MMAAGARMFLPGIGIGIIISLCLASSEVVELGEKAPYNALTTERLRSLLRRGLLTEGDVTTLREMSNDDADHLFDSVKDLGESARTGVGNFHGALMTSGSFTMMAAGGFEEERKERDELSTGRKLLGSCTGAACTDTSGVVGTWPTKGTEDYKKKFTMIAALFSIFPHEATVSKGQEEKPATQPTDSCISGCTAQDIMSANNCDINLNLGVATTCIKKYKFEGSCYYKKSVTFKLQASGSSYKVEVTNFELNHLTNTESCMAWSGIG